METEGQNTDVTKHSETIKTLISMFGERVSEDVILTILESCDGDLNLSAEAIMDITSEMGSTEPAEKEDTVEKPEQSQTNVEQPNQRQSELEPTRKSVYEMYMEQPLPSEMGIEQLQTYSSNEAMPAPHSTPNVDEWNNEPAMAQLTMSFANAFKSTGAVPKWTQQIPTPPNLKESLWTEQFQRIVNYHNQGSRVLILMRGVPGSGKSYLAKQIVEATIGNSFIDFKTHICSTDDFFMVRGVYAYDRQRLSDAHDWNQSRVSAALKQGLSPVIVDNTNVNIWEMEVYVRKGVENGYFIEVMEPNTPWAKKLNQLVKRNTHNVRPATIQRMLDNFQSGITGEYLIVHYGLSYPSDMVPPVMRNIPAYCPSYAEVPTPSYTGQINHDYNVQEQDSTHNIQTNETKDYTSGFDEATSITACETTNPTCDEETDRHQRYLEIQKQIEEIEKLNEQWEKGENWDECQDKKSPREGVTSNDYFVALNEPKPPRNDTSSEGFTPRENLMESAVQNINDWREISMYMPPWINDSYTQEDQDTEITIETKSTGTLVEPGDSDYPNKKYHKVVSAVPRDINIFYIPPNREKIPNIRMLDKSTLTSQQDIICEASRCKNEEKHFNAFRKMFKNVPKAELRDIFDKCCGDVHWAVDIVVNGTDDNYKNIQVEDGEVSDDEDEVLQQCSCMAAYDLVPDTADPPKPIEHDKGSIVSTSNNSEFVTIKKVKLPSESQIQLKRDIEKNFVISDSYYSDHVLKIRKFRRGEIEVTENTNINETRNEMDRTLPEEENARALPSDTEKLQSSTSRVETTNDDDSSSSGSADEVVETTVNMYVGKEFLVQLDNLFGRAGLVYPENVVPRINIPVSLLQEINAFWLESLMYQLDEHDKQNSKMIEEDADFARQLALKEAELARQGKEPDVPDLKEIMNMDLAVSLYQKEIDAEWKSREPNDLAAKLTREKLFNLFPAMSKDVLAELLMAHDNCFQATVEVLLMSTGQASILEEKNGLNKFVMKREMERQEKILEEQKKALSEVEWPLLPKGGKVQMSTVNQYRDEAEKHLYIRNLNYQKAQEFMRRGMTQVASYYSEVANFHKKKFEQANSMAAASLMQIHAENCQDNATIDLHFLRVGEARESLDLFLDTHIQKLRECVSRGVKAHTLFFITGRGLHSSRGPKVKPAVKKRLRERGLVFHERNPGLLTARTDDVEINC